MFTVEKRNIVLVEPEKPENTGFIARLAYNYDYTLRVVNPDFNLSEARKTAKNAQEILRNAKIFDEVEEAVEDLEYVVGTKPGRGRKLSGFPARRNTSVMIGRESSGLSNNELELCDAVVHIHTPGYQSLNQSHAAAILLYGLRNPDKPGITGKQKEKLKEVASETVYETLVNANPSKDKVGRIIGDLKK